MTTQQAEREQLRAGSSTRAARILIADDQIDVIEALRLLLKGEGYQIESATSPAQILRAAESSDLDVVLMDLNYARDTTSGQEGLDLLSRIAQHGIQSMRGEAAVAAEENFFTAHGERILTRKITNREIPEISKPNIQMTDNNQIPMSKIQLR